MSFPGEFVLKSIEMYRYNGQTQLHCIQLITVFSAGSDSDEEPPSKPSLHITLGGEPPGTLTHLDTGFSDLPPEIALRILSHLSPQDLCRGAQVCQQWSDLCMDPQLWPSLLPVQWATGNSHLGLKLTRLTF